MRRNTFKTRLKATGVFVGLLGFIATLILLIDEYPKIAIPIYGGILLLALVIYWLRWLITGKG